MWVINTEPTIVTTPVRDMEKRERGVQRKLPVAPELFNVFS